MQSFSRNYCSHFITVLNSLAAGLSLELNGCVKLYEVDNGEKIPEVKKKTSNILLASKLYSKI